MVAFRQARRKEAGRDGGLWNETVFKPNMIEEKYHVAIKMRLKEQLANCTISVDKWNTA